jgi:hypothetical protein
MNALEDRLGRLESVLADPPRVHESMGAEGGVWGTSVDCYRWLAERCGPGVRTLETGCGISTALFAVWGCSHTCVVYNQVEVDVMRTWAAERSIALDDVTFVVGSSADVLPGLESPAELDVMFVDGNHGFPAAILDWYYGAGRLVDGGAAVFDDIQLASVRLGLFEFLDADPRWEPVALTEKWAAVLRRSSGSLGEDWPDQPFLNSPPA